jgi:hypothetical protein
MVATLRVPVDPLSTSERRVFAVGVFVSLILKVPFELLAPKVITGEVAVSASGELLEVV